jgi:hypothetical protein
MTNYTPEETRARISHSYTHDRKKARLLLVFPALHDLPLDGADAALGTGQPVELPISELRPRLEQLAHALGAIYTRGRGDHATICQMVERSIMVSVSLDDFPDAREIFSSSLADALARGRDAYPERPAAAAPLAETDRTRAALDHIYRFRRDEARALAGKPPKRAPGRPPKSAETIARERAAREEFARRRDALKAEHRRALDALDDAEAEALRLTRQGVDVLAEVGPDADGGPAA